MGKLFNPYKIGQLEIKNRVVMAPMCMDSAEEDGYATEWHKLHYATRAVSGIGLILLEATAVESRGRITNQDLGLWHDGQIEGLKDIVRDVHRLGSKIGIQLAHAGRKCELVNEVNIAPSAIAFSENYQTPKEMTQEDIETVIKSFVDAAVRAEKAGFDLIELHGAHGYLINEFMSSLTNKRNDPYGGSLVNRARFLKELVTAVRAVWPKHKPILLRVSAEEYLENGNGPEDVAKIINEVKLAGIDLIDVSSGGVAQAQIHTYPGYQIHLATVIKNKTGLPVIGGGLVTTAKMAEEIVVSERSDLIFIGRELLRNPYWTMHAAKELESEHEWPVQYLRSKEIRKNGF